MTRSPDIDFENRVELIARVLARLILPPGHPVRSICPEPDVPSWCQRIGEQLNRTILKPLLALDPEGRGPDWENHGKMLGVVLRSIAFLQQETAPLVKTQLPRITAPKESRREPAEQAPQQVIADFVVQRPPAEQQALWRGIAGGYGLFINEQGQLAASTGRTNIYLALLGFYPEIEQMRQSQKTRKDLLQWLALHAPWSLPHPDAASWLDDVCDEIGLRLKSPGRPRKNARRR